MYTYKYSQVVGKIMGAQFMDIWLELHSENRLKFQKITVELTFILKPSSPGMLSWCGLRENARPV